MTDGFSVYEYKIENETMLLTRTVTSGVRGYKLIRLEQLVKIFKHHSIPWEELNSGP